MKLRFILLLLAMAGLAATPLPAQNAQLLKLSLTECMELALRDNETILIAGNAIESADQRIREAWADALPEIDFNALYTRTFKDQIIFFPDIFGGDPTRQVAIPISSKNAYSFSFTLNQPLFQAGKISSGIKVAKFFKKFSHQQYEAVQADVILSVKVQYYTVLLSNQQLDINRQSMEQQYANLLNTRKLFEQGQVSELDTLRAWVTYTNLQPLVIRSENNLRIARNQLKAFVGLNLNQPISLTDKLEFQPTESPSLAALQEEALQKQPELKQLEYEAAMRRENIGITRSDHYPKLYLSSTYQSVAQSNSFDFGNGLESSFSGALRLEIPIFKGFRTSAKVQEAKLDHQTSLHQIDRFEDRMMIDVKSIFLKIQEAEKRVQVQQHAIKQAERALFMAQRRYNEGVGTQLERSDALLSLNVTKTNYIRAIYDHKVALAQMEKAVGRI